MSVHVTNKVDQVTNKISRNIVFVQDISVELCRVMCSPLCREDKSNATLNKKIRGAQLDGWCYQASTSKSCIVLSYFLSILMF